MKISTCIITYNHEEYIKQCIEGALNQKLDYDYEIIIGEDCSTDNTLIICEEYAQKYPDLIRIIKRPKNIGMINNWADTIKSCKGKYIAICEGDDYWTDSYKLQKQVDFLEKNENHSACGTYCNIERFEKLEFPDSMHFQSFNLYDVINRNGVPTLTLLFRNNLVIYNQLVNYPIADIALLLELTKSKNKIAKLPFNSAVYRYHGKGLNSGNSRFYNQRVQFETKYLYSKYNNNLLFKIKLKIYFLKNILKELNLFFRYKNLFDINILKLDIEYLFKF